jgi:hypothetical protein
LGCSLCSTRHASIICVGDSHKVPLITGETPFFEKMINANKRATNPKNTLPVVAAQSGKAHDPKKPQRPTNRPVATPLGQFSASLEGLTPLGQQSASLEGLAPPRVILRLAQGPGTPSGDSPPRSRPTRAHDVAPTPLTRALNVVARRGRPGQKVNPHHAGPLTPPGNHVPELFRQPALRGHPWHCTGSVR